MSNNVINTYTVYIQSTVSALSKRCAFDGNHLGCLCFICRAAGVPSIMMTEKAISVSRARSFLSFAPFRQLAAPPVPPCRARWTIRCHRRRRWRRRALGSRLTPWSCSRCAPDLPCLLMLNRPLGLFPGQEQDISTSCAVLFGDIGSRERLCHRVPLYSPERAHRTYGPSSESR